MRAAPTRSGPPVPPATAHAPQRVPSASGDVPEDQARFARFAAPRVVLPLSGHELAAAYLRVAVLDPMPVIAARLGLSYSAAAMVLMRAKMKLGAEERDYGWYSLIAQYFYEVGYAAGRESVRV